MANKPAGKDHVRVWTERGTTYVRMPIAIAAGILLALLIVTTLLWTSKWRRDPKLQVKQPGELQALIPSLVALGGGTLEAGNRVEVLQNGDGFFPPLFRDIRAARQSVHLESYIWWEGRVCDDLARLLAEKARQGVEVRLLVDASGGKKMTDEQDKLMTGAGVRIARFHPIRFSNLGRLNNRDHRKQMIIDGRIGYLGGYGIAKEWTGNANDKEHWRDTGLRIEGPIVNRLQAAFCENWIEETGEIPAGERYFPRLQPVGQTPAHLSYTSPTGSVSSVQVLYYVAIESAKREILIQNPYLLPEVEAIDALDRAVKRGVDVKIMVPSADATDAPIVQHASHHRFGNLLKHGVKIYEYEKTLLHQKVMVIDGVWATVGSTNFDSRSFELNDEITIGVVDPAVAQQLRAAFAADLQHSRERRFDEWKSRSLWHKLIDGLAYVGNEQL